MPVTLLLMRKICREMRSARAVNRLSSLVSGAGEKESTRRESVGAHTAPPSVKLTSIRQCHLIRARVVGAASSRSRGTTASCQSAFEVAERPDEGEMGIASASRLAAG